MSHVLATQSLWQRRPKTMRVSVDGRLGHGVFAKDVVLAIIARIGAAGATGHVIEYAGSAIAGLSMEGRLTVCNMSIEAGARAGMIAPDDPRSSTWRAVLTRRPGVHGRRSLRAGGAWGPYLSERQWGTVREDYSDDGNAWDYFSHDQSRSRAYRWGEDGLAGICDDKQRLCFALALWNERDPILKERLFGLTNSEGNHGEDVKEYYFYLDSTPTHSYMKYLYKYPQRGVPVPRPGRDEPPAVARRDSSTSCSTPASSTTTATSTCSSNTPRPSPEDILVRITVHNRGPEAARLHVLPTLWFRNTWSWGERRAPKPSLRERGTGRDSRPRTPTWATYWLHCEGAPELLFTENESNARASLGPAERVAVRQGRVPRLRRRRPARRGESRARRDQGRGALRARRAGRRQPDGPSAAARRRQAQDAFGGFDEVVREPHRGRRRVLRADHAASR